MRDAPDILSEDLDWRGGYERVLTAMAGGARRRSRIASRAQQRIDYTLDRLRRVCTGGPAGRRGGSPDPLYEIADDYLAFWFAVLRDDADLIEGGQGGAVQLRMAGRWQAGDMTERDLTELRRRAGHLPETSDLSGATYAFWSRGGPDQALARHPDVRVFGPADLLNVPERDRQ